MSARGLLADLRRKHVFLAVDGSELIIRAPKGTLDDRLTRRIKESKADLCDLLSGKPLPELFPYAELSEEELDLLTEAKSFEHSGIQDIYRLGPFQEGVLFQNLLGGDGDAYLMRSVIEFDAREEMDAFLSAIQTVIARHDILRSSMRWKGLRKPIQIVHRNALMPVYELSARSDEEAMDVLLSKTDPERNRLDLEHAPLLQASIIKKNNDSGWIMGLLYHHLVCDHVTLDLLISEVREVLAGRVDQLQKPVSYGEFIADTLSKPQAWHESYFREQLKGVDEPTLPFELVDVRGTGGSLAEEEIEVKGVLSQRIRDAARREGVSPAVLFHLAWARVAGCCSNRDDVVFGTVLSGRQQGMKGADRALGTFINTLPVRLKLHGVSVKDAVSDMQKKLIDLLEHEQASLVLAQRCSEVDVSIPLFSSVLNYRHNRRAQSGDIQAIPLASARIVLEQERSSYPLTINLGDDGECFTIAAQCLPRINPSRIAKYLMQAVSSLVEALSYDPGKHVDELQVIPDIERDWLVGKLNGTGKEKYKGVFAQNLFERCVDAKPSAVAIVHEGGELTYDELNRNANRLAHFLISKGVRLGERVAVCAERSPEMVTALLGVIKAGGVYVPLDPSYSRERLSYILDDSHPAFIITTSQVAGTLPQIEVPVLPLGNEPEGYLSLPDGNIAPASLGLKLESGAYVIYTSGSTGHPKGVLNTMDGLVNRLLWMSDNVLIDPPVTALKTSIGFVDSITEVLDALTAGGKLVVFDKQTAHDPVLFARRVREGGVTNLMVVPSLLRSLLDNASSTFHSMRTVLSSGERIPQELINRFKSQCPDVRLYNTYGCSEVNGDATACECHADPDLSRSSIGKPISNARVYVLDQKLQPVPTEVLGEIYIGGIGVSRGYINNDALTSERFVPDPFRAEGAGLVYRTGDFGKIRSDGSIEYLGRRDFQVKIRGFRVELGEIESRLQAHPLVETCVVTSREDKSIGTTLTAYIVGKDEADPEGNRKRKSKIGFSLFYFSARDDFHEDKYQLYLQAAKFADENGLEAIWTPERHFNNVAGLFPNPSVLSAALAVTTRNVQLRAGSVVLPLHSTPRVAEEWSVVDNLSNGRVGLAIASGWHHRDFVLYPSHFSDRKSAMLRELQSLRALWRGESIPFKDGRDSLSDIATYPRPIQKELPIWLTSVGNADTFVEAGRLGVNVLTNLLGQDIDELGRKIALYRESLERHGHDPSAGKVTLMVHTYMGDDLEQTLDAARGPFKDYMRQHLGLLRTDLYALRIVMDDGDPNDVESITEHAFRRYTKSASFIGTPVSCLEVADRLADVGVDEFACLFDWIDQSKALDALPHVSRFQELFNQRELTTGILRKHMTSLPDYMRPSKYIILDEMPLTSSGKIDRGALPDAASAHAEEKHDYEAPRGDIENALARLWGVLLDVERVGRNDNFFSLGGHSLLTVALATHIRNFSGIDVSVAKIFQNPTIAELAKVMMEGGPTQRVGGLDATLSKLGDLSDDDLHHMAQENHRKLEHEVRRRDEAAKGAEACPASDAYAP
jgi:natural product biosynthesis luciferase-like monooxygenase protein/amino acid adenylation domain-containing protein